jgi:hypothetical protein
VAELCFFKKHRSVFGTGSLCTELCVEGHAKENLEINEYFWNSNFCYSVYIPICVNCAFPFKGKTCCATMILYDHPFKSYVPL